MTDDILIEVNQSPLTLGDCVEYLRRDGRLPATIGAIIRQHVLTQELDQHRGMQVNPLLIDLVMRRLAHDHGSDTDEMMQEWLRLRGQDLQSFRQNVTRHLLIEQLKHGVTDPDLSSYFEARAPFLRRVTIARLELEDWDTAAQALQAIRNGRSFEALAFDRAQVSENAFVAETVLWADLPLAIRRGADAARPGDVLGPFSLGEGACLVRLVQIWPADLADLRVRQALRDELFEAWIAGRIEAQAIKCNVSIGSERPPA
ncbi:MAG: peptidylprolyl isomerase [Alphaproteobacteria bacterium]